MMEYNKASKKIKTFVPNVGDVILVYDDKLKRCLWKMGRVSKLIYSKDGLIRASEVTTIPPK